jgi:hypothetical protein
MQTITDYDEKASDQKDPSYDFLYRVGPRPFNGASPHGDASHDASPHDASHLLEGRIHPPLIPSAHWLLAVAAKLIWIVLKEVIRTIRPSRHTARL